MTNMGFGTVNNKVRLRIVFPGTYQDGEAPRPYPSETFREYFVDEVLLPVMHEIHGAQAIHWPLDRSHKMWTARVSSGHLFYSQKGVPHSALETFLPKMHTRVRDLKTPLAKLMEGFIIYWEIQDIKLNTTFIPHPDVPLDRQVRRNAVKVAFAQVGIRDLNQDNVHVDLAVEMSLPDKSLYFRTSGHASILHSMLGYTPGEARTAVTRYGASALYQKDRMCSLDAISGFHLKLGGTATPHGMLGAQAYHTEKEIAYQASSDNKIVPLHPVELLKDSDPERSTSFLRWTKSCLEVLDKQREMRICGTARFEVTVPLSQLDRTCLDYDADLLMDALVAFPLDVIP